MVLWDLKMMRQVRTMWIKCRSVVTTILMSSVAHSMPENWLYEVLNLNVGAMILLMVHCILMLSIMAHSERLRVKTFSPVFTIDEGGMMVIFAVDVSSFSPVESFRAMLWGWLLDDEVHRIRKVHINFVLKIVIIVVVVVQIVLVAVVIKVHLVAWDEWLSIGMRHFLNIVSLLVLIRCLLFNIDVNMVMFVFFTVLAIMLMLAQMRRKDRQVSVQVA